MVDVNFLKPILTPAALRSVQADPYPLLILLLVIIGLTAECVLCWYIHYVTEKAYPKKKQEGAKKKWPLDLNILSRFRK